MSDAPVERQAAFRAEPWVEVLQYVARHYRLPVSIENARLESLWQTGKSEEDRIAVLARGAGLQVRFAEPHAFPLTSERVPIIVELGQDQLAVVTAIGTDGEASLVMTGEGGLVHAMTLSELQQRVVRYIVPRPSRAVPDARVDNYIRPYEEHWLRRVLLKDSGSYSHILVASLITNLLGLVTVLFSMQVYDRVVPSASYPTLYVLFFGVLLAFGFDFLLRRLRMAIIDVLGKRADMRISDTVFGHALRVRSQARPKSTGSFIAQLRDLEQVREVLTSTTVAALADLPFFLLFLVIFWYIGGLLVLVPLGALVLLLLPGILAQRRLRAHANEAMREASLRNAMLVETVQGLDDIKALQAEGRFQHQWNHFNAVAGEAQLRLRALTNSLTAWTQLVQNGVYVTVIFFGAPLVMDGVMTTGALVAASILGSRMMAPMAQVAQILNRLQQARVGMESVDRIMALPVDNPDREHRIAMPALRGNYTLRSAQFAYDEDDGAPVLNLHSLNIAEGEKIALIGRIGAGKSTLLRSLSGLLHPRSGEVLLDDRALPQIDPADVRRDVGLLMQGSRLFHGTIRDNLILGAPQASDEALLSALVLSGADEFVRRLKAGLEHVVQEGGGGLSGGQVQALLLARVLVRQSPILLLDEPTASMDEATERVFIDRFKGWSQSKTLVIATHRMRVLDLVDRIVILHNGEIALDAGKAEALRAMRSKGVAA